MASPLRGEGKITDRRGHACMALLAKVELVSIGGGGGGLYEAPYCGVEEYPPG